PPNIFDAVEVSGEASWGLCNFAVAQSQGQANVLAGQLQARDAELAGATAQLAAAAAHAAQLERQLAGVSEQAAASAAKVEELKHNAYYWWHTAEELRRETGVLSYQLGQVYASKSWRLTAPLRVANAHTLRARRFAGRV